jgi:ABC-2 type transport system ATP-binding protein
MTNVIEVSQLYKSFGQIKALQGVTFNVAQNEVFGYLGHNGAGKTTTIRLLLGLLKPDAGQVLIFGEDPYPDDQLRQALRKRIGVVLEEDFLYPYMTGEEYLIFWANLYSVPRQEVRQRVEKALHLVGMAERGRSIIGTYSKGMCRRLAIARALLNQPELLILDEPTVGLDPEARAYIHTLIKDLVASNNLTVFLTSHDLEEVERLCNRVAIIEKGKIVLSGTVAELRRGVQPELVIRFIPLEGSLLPEPVLQRLKALPFVADFDLREDVLHVKLIDFNQSPELISILVNEGIRISEVRQHIRSLEDIYFEIMRRHESAE